MDAYYDVIIVGSGMSGLYAALQVKKLCPDLTCLVIERNQLFGGKAYEHRFENTDVVTGAGIGRKNKDKLLLKLMREFQIPIHFFETEHKYSELIHPPCDVKAIFALLKRTYESEKVAKIHTTTFKQYATAILGEAAYKHFILCAGYSDYEQADVYDTLYHYNFDDNYNKWVGFSVPWKALVDKIVHSLGHKRIINNTEVTKIHIMADDVFEVATKRSSNSTNYKYYCEKLVIATDIDSLTSLIRTVAPRSPRSPALSSLYTQIQGQSFLRLYAKFSRESVPHIKEKVQGVTVVEGPMQKIIPMNPDKGVYMIIYSDNKDADFFKRYFNNTRFNRDALNRIFETSLGLEGKLRIESIKEFYWKNGTHYYKPLAPEFKTRQEFIRTAQHPYRNVLVVGEMISIYQGWVEGALESVHNSLTKEWLRY
jgi:hypothetical protein